MNSKQCVQPPCLLEAPFLEYSIHQCPKQMLKELRLIFPDLQNTQNSPTLYIIPTFQPCQNDLLCEVTPAVEAEKDQLLENFCSWAKIACLAFQSLGYFADMSDPSSGYP
eukprot:Sdes_comp19317_c0_seq3m10456